MSLNNDEHRGAGQYFLRRGTTDRSHHQFPSVNYQSGRRSMFSPLSPPAAVSFDERAHRNSQEHFSDIHGSCQVYSSAALLGGGSIVYPTPQRFLPPANLQLPLLRSFPVQLPQSFPSRASLIVPCRLLFEENEL
ncbi:hypothetical protein M758_11G035700, partial [Ceratodon purpureus]